MHTLPKRERECKKPMSTITQRYCIQISACSFVRALQEKLSSAEPHAGRAQTDFCGPPAVPPATGFTVHVLFDMYSSLSIVLAHSPLYIVYLELGGYWDTFLLALWHTRMLCERQVNFKVFLCRFAACAALFRLYPPPPCWKLECYNCHPKSALGSVFGKKILEPLTIMFVCSVRSLKRQNCHFNKKKHLK